MLIAFALALATGPVDQPPASPCSVAVESYREKNALELVRGYQSCLEEERIDDAAFLDLLTRIRLGADALLVSPSDPSLIFNQPEFLMAYSRQNRFADETLARDPARFDALVARVKEADLSVAPSYSPGWAFEMSSKRPLYDEVANGVREDSLAMEIYIATRVRDDTYFAAYQERQALLEQLRDDNSSELPSRYGEVTQIMQARVEELGEPPQRSAVPWRKVYEPGPEVGHTVLHRGFNGPEGGSNELFRTSSEVSLSWLSAALGTEALASVLSQVDFESEVLAVYAVGEMRSASQNVFVTEFGPDEDGEGYSIRIVVGVVGEHCGTEPRQSYPFVLVKAPSSNEGGITSSFRQNYPDECGPIMAGVSVGES